MAGAVGLIILAGLVLFVFLVWASEAVING